eukprot:TRINITY_DN388_c0_g1_i1.p1 TRINITY_DN388_c0_g1~~TRINITY_DN388_c0_g1_i1.p1  ORF type:complete len:240 (+),score=72.55 TRINITY_DN388_c0_g1_i1:59-778(+)
MLPAFRRLFSTAKPSAFSLNVLKDNSGAISSRKRVGRGAGSGLGKTSGRGHKGQKARSGGGPAKDFEGGQTKLARRIPKHGFVNPGALVYQSVNLSTIQHWIDTGRINASEPITMKTLFDCGILNKVEWPGIKLLGDGAESFNIPINIEVARASLSAIAAVERAGGNVTCAYYNKLNLRAHLKPEKFRTIPKRATPPPKLIKYYSQPEIRGYLADAEQIQSLKNEAAKELAASFKEMRL